MLGEVLECIDGHLAEVQEVTAGGGEHGVGTNGGDEDGEAAEFFAASAPSAASASSSSSSSSSKQLSGSRCNMSLSRSRREQNQQLAAQIEYIFPKIGEFFLDYKDLFFFCQKLYGRENLGGAHSIF